MSFRGVLQRGTIEFSDFAFNENGSAIYAATGNRKSIQIGRYPELVRDDEVLLGGFPQFIFLDGNKIVCVLTQEEENIRNPGRILGAQTVTID